MEVLAIVTLGSALVAYFYWRNANADSQARRASSAGCVLALVALFALGSIWPSAHTFAAALAFPAIFIFGYSFFRPGVLDRPLVNLYTRVCVVLPPLSFAFQLWWLNGGCEVAGKCL